jgi:hypothetical protein
MRMPAHTPAGGARIAVAHTFAALAVVVRLFPPLNNGRARATAVADLVKAVALEHLVELNLRETVAADERVVAADGAGTALLERGERRPLASPRDHRLVLHRHLLPRLPCQTRSRRLPVPSRASNPDAGEKLAGGVCTRARNGATHRACKIQRNHLVVLGGARPHHRAPFLRQGLRHTRTS